MLSQDNGNEYNTNMWWYRKIVLWIVDVFREYGIEVEVVPEYYTSKECSACGEIHDDGRVYRGLYICNKTGRKINADVNAALNIARRQGYRIIITRKIESYLVRWYALVPIDVELVPEYYTSRECSICGEVHDNGRMGVGVVSICG
jgi:putative transposase